MAWVHSREQVTSRAPLNEPTRADDSDPDGDLVASQETDVRLRTLREAAEIVELARTAARSIEESAADRHLPSSSDPDYADMTDRLRNAGRRLAAVETQLWQLLHETAAVRAELLTAAGLLGTEADDPVVDLTEAERPEHDPA